MKYLAIALLFVGVIIGQAVAQSWQTTPPVVALAVTTCGTLPAGYTYVAGNYAALTVNTSGSLCVNQ